MGQKQSRISGGSRGLKDLLEEEEKETCSNQSEKVLIDNSLYEYCGPWSPTSPSLEVVFFHGMEKGDWSKAYYDTWKSRNGSVFWPQSWLGEEFPNSRILSVSYDSSMKKGESRGRLDSYCTAENLITNLERVVVGTQANCPLVMVGKDSGCLIIQLVCMKAKEKRKNAFLNKIKGFVFYCPPFMGLQGIPDAFDGELVQMLRSENRDVFRVNEQFGSLQQEYRWKTMVMAAGNRCKNGKPIEYIPESSSRVNANVYYTAPEDISSICRPASKKSISFKHLKDFISDILCNRGHKCELPSYLVGSQQAAVIEEKLEGTSIVGIVGMGGIGKTTLAKLLYNSVSSGFDYTCFMEGVKEFSEDHKLKNRMKENFYHLGESVESFSWSYLIGKKTLIVMDDVDSADQLNSSLPKLDTLGENSVIVITTRDSQHVLDFSSQHVIHDMDFLQGVDAQQLFCHYAFEKDYIPTELTEVVQQVITKCDRLPLTLEVLGQYLRGKEVLTVWQETFERLENAESASGNAADRLWAKLKISYDNLEKSAKAMFIDAGTIFLGQPTEEALAFWSTGPGKQETGWINLVNKHLVKSLPVLSWDDDFSQRVPIEKIWMHEQLKDLAKQLKAKKLAKAKKRAEAKVQLKDNANIDSCNLWCPLSVSGLYRHRVLFEPDKYLVLANVSYEGPKEKFPRDLQLLKWSGYWDSPILLPIELDKMKKLAVLELANFKQVQPFKFPKALRILKLREIVGLDQLPTDVGWLLSLRVLHLECVSLAELPESFGKLSSLVTLIIRRCDKLRNLPKSFGDLKALQHLIIGSLKSDGSVQLRTLPESFGQLTALSELVIHAPQLERLPKNFELLTALTKLVIRSHQLERLPENFGLLKALSELVIDAPQLESLPNNFALLTSLQKLKLCSPKIEHLPQNFEQLRSLTEFYMRGEGVRSLPLTFGQLPAMKKLRLESSQLQTLPKSFGELTALSELVIHAPELESLPDNLGFLTSLLALTIHSGKAGIFEQLKNLPEFPCMEKLELKAQLCGRCLEFVGCASLRSCLVVLANYQLCENYVFCSAHH